MSRCAGFNLAFAVWILNAYFASIPAGIEEAAMVDGSGRINRLYGPPATGVIEETNVS